MQSIAIKTYRLLEQISGQTGKRLISYKVAEKIKLFCLIFVN